MSIEEMRKALKDAYPGANWPSKVDAMPDKQVAAIYARFLDSEKL